MLSLFSFGSRCRRRIPFGCERQRMMTYSGFRAGVTVIVLYLLGSLWYFLNRNSLSRVTRRIDGEMVYYKRMKRIDGNRTRIAQTEFFRPRPSHATVSDFFRLDESKRNSQKIALEPLWTCSPGSTVTGSAGRHLYGHEMHSHGERKQKLVFLQMSRTAGSTIRGLLKAYATKCLASVAAVARCIDLDFDLMNRAEIWRNARDSRSSGQTCLLTHLANRTDDTNVQRGLDVPLDGRVSSTLLQNNQVDILMGKLSLGIDQFWYSVDVNGNRIPANAVYVAFLRDPLHRLVSESVSQIVGHVSIDDTANLVYMEATKELAHGRHLMHFSNYLITPRQKNWVENEGILWTAERRVNLSLSNLVEKQVLVGLVERMHESIELLQYVLDKENQVPDLFGFFMSPKNVDKLANVAARNLTLAVVDTIRRSPSMVASIGEYVKYDAQIYDFARQMHEMQYKLLRDSE